MLSGPRGLHHFVPETFVKLPHLCSFGKDASSFPDTLYSTLDQDESGSFLLLITCLFLPTCGFMQSSGLCCLELVPEPQDNIGNTICLCSLEAVSLLRKCYEFIFPLHSLIYSFKLEGFSQVTGSS